MGRKGKSFSDPNVDKIEVYRAHTTQHPLVMGNQRVPRSLANGTPGEARKKIMEQFRKSASGNPPLRAHGITAPIIFNEKSLKHDFSRNLMSRQRLSILTNYERMDQLLRGGTVLERRINTANRSGKEVPAKKNWERFWEVKGSVMIGNKRHRFTFSIYQEKWKRNANIYDFTLKR